MSLRTLPLILLCCCLLAGPVQALDPGKDFRHYVRTAWSTQDGLGHGLLAVTQTPDGYLWAGTQTGLGRFDGAGFTTFSPATDPALPHRAVSALAVGADGALWIGTVAGLAVLRESSFHRVPWPGDDNSPRVEKLRRAPDGGIWAATNLGIARVDNGRVQPLPGIEPATAVAVTADGTVWAGHLGGVSRWDGKAWKRTTWPGAESLLVLELDEIDGALWAATTRGLHVRGPSGWKPAPGTAQWRDHRFDFVYRDSQGNVWAGGDQGLVRIRPGGATEFVPASFNNQLSNLVTAFEDQEGNLWLGSQDLIRLWDGWTRRYSTPQGLHHPATWSVAGDPEGNAIWVGTSDGVARLDADGRFTPITSESGPLGTVVSLWTEPGRVWIGGVHGLALYEPGSGRQARVPEWARDIKVAVSGFSRDAKGHLWLGTMNALLRWDGRTLERFDASRGLPGPLAERNLVVLRDGRGMAMSRSGLFQFDGDGFVPAPESADLPEGVRLDALTELSDGRLLLSTDDDRMLLRHHDRWLVLDEAAGFDPGGIYQMVEHEGTLWMSISVLEGVARLPLEELTAFAEGRIDRIRPQVVVNERGIPNGGVQTMCCNGATGWHHGLIVGDTFWVPTNDGVLAIDTRDVVANPHPPRVQLGRVGVRDQWRTLAPGNDVFDAGERDLTLAFDILSFQDPRSNQVRYRLAGYDREWNSAASMVREVRYTNLPPGDYTFEVLASNNDGVWTGDAAQLGFSIRPRFHETLASRLLGILVLALLVYAGYRYQRYRYRVRQAKLEWMVAQRTEDLVETNRQLELASLTDPLTGLRNRRYLTQQIPADLNYYDRQLAAAPDDGQVLVFAMLDLDHFKQVNDVHGHAAGDCVLAETGRRLKHLVRAGDYVVRWGGEEFLLVFRPMPAGHVRLLGDRLCGAVSDTPFDIGEGRQLDLTASAGLSEYPLFNHAGRPLGWEAMIELADQAAYHVKRNGRDGWAMFRPTATTRVDTLLADLQRGPQALLRDGALELVGSRHRTRRQAGATAIPG